MFVKVCGLKRREEIDWAIELGYSAVGMVLHPGSKRQLDKEAAAELAAYAGERIIKVAVAKKYSDLAEVSHCFDFIQVYEEVDIPNLIYAGKSLPEKADYIYFLYDISMGSGEFAEFPRWLKSIRNRLILAGGLGPENVRRAMEAHRPFGVDVSSGVEENGRKSMRLMKEFICEVNNASG